MVGAIKQATEIRQAGIYLLAVVDGQEVDLTAALERSRYLLLTVAEQEHLAAWIETGEYTFATWCRRRLATPNPAAPKGRL
jgi:hypothetical protein